jgi:hypothetical protein
LEITVSQPGSNPPLVRIYAGLPICGFSDGTRMERPTIRQIIEKLASSPRATSATGRSSASLQQ